MADSMASPVAFATMTAPGPAVQPSQQVGQLHSGPGVLSKPGASAATGNSSSGFAMGAVAVAALAVQAGRRDVAPKKRLTKRNACTVLERATDEEELLFQPGQRIVVSGPPAMAGKQGTVVGPALNDSFAIQFDSGSTFNIPTNFIQDTSAGASAPVAAPVPVSTPAPAPVQSSGMASEEDELEFQTGQRVIVTGPPAMAGKQGSVVRPALNDSFAIQFDSGSIFNIPTSYIQDAAAPAAAPVPVSTPAPSFAPSSGAATDEDELEFQPGQRVTVSGPPAMSGKQGDVVGPALGDSFAIRFDSGSIFNIPTPFIQAVGGAPAPSAASASGPAKKLTVPAQLLDSTDVFIFDCDGVIWRGDSVIPGIPNVLDKLRQAGKTMFFVTNNSTKSRAGYKGKFTSLGLNVQAEEIFSSSFAAAAYLEQTNFKQTGKKVYVIGEKGIGEELDLIGVPWVGAEADMDQKPNMGSGGRLEIDHNVGAVIVGFDRHINYYKLQYAQLCINELPGCQFIATNLDRVTHLTDAQEWAGNGTMVGAVKGCTGVEPELVGKPAPLMIDYIADKYGIKDRSRICMVGDRLDTDIAFGRNNGLKTCLTLSGVTSEPELLDQVPRKAGTEGIQPEFYVDTINDFVA